MTNKYLRIWLNMLYYRCLRDVKPDLFFSSSPYLSQVFRSIANQTPPETTGCQGIAKPRPSGLPPVAFLDDLLCLFCPLHRCFTASLQPRHNGAFMTTSIVPNIALGMGVILILTLPCGSVKEIPCHNTATAEYLARYYKRS